MKKILLIASLACITILSSIHGDVSKNDAHPFPIQTPLKTANLDGYLIASNKYFTATFNVEAIGAIFYSRDNKMTIVSFSGSVMLGNSRTNILIDDAVMEYEEVLTLIENERQKPKN